MINFLYNNFGNVKEIIIYYWSSTLFKLWSVYVLTPVINSKIYHGQLFTQFSNDSVNDFNVKSIILSIISFFKTNHLVIISKCGIFVQDRKNNRFVCRKHLLLFCKTLTGMKWLMESSFVLILKNIHAKYRIGF